MRVSDFRKKLKQAGFAEDQIEAALFAVWKAALTLGNLKELTQEKYDELVRGMDKHGN